ncbi:MAG: helix-turn-helix domain-containing protein [candidate division WOR-3 bacterium]|nr:MAG: helix-turn-helix domain-containing protein [candidate division WOR-3 bacterium]
MQKRPESTFDFPPELGQRRRELRLKAGLTQQRLASLMGRKARAMQPRIARLETGKIEFPTIAFIADYLRACRAGFRDVLDILDACTSRPHSVLNRLRLSPASSVRQQLAVHGRKVWGILNRTRLKNQERRASLLAQAADRLKQEHLAPVDLARTVAQQVTELFDRMEQSGELDKYPTTALAEKLTAQSPRKRVRTDVDLSRQASWRPWDLRRTKSTRIWKRLAQRHGTWWKKKVWTGAWYAGTAMPPAS